MAYTVGSASVDIVPDFHGAQLKLTAWFKKIQDEIRIPVEPELDRSAARRVEQEARSLGNRVGRAINEGASRDLGRELSREVSRLERDLREARNAGRHAADASERAEARLNESRRKGNDTIRRTSEFERAAERARRRGVETSDRLVRAEQALNDARRRQTDQRIRDRERALNSSAAREVRQAVDTAQRIANERRRIQDRELAEGRRVRDQFAREEQRFAEKAGRDAMRAFDRSMRETSRRPIRTGDVDTRHIENEGRRAGGVFSRALGRELRQNGFFIGAIIAAALIAGAPLALAAASGLFIGIAAVAAAQSERIRRTWVGLWDTIKQGTIEDSQVLIPVFQRVAGAAEQSFSRMRPLLRDAFVAVGPHIETFSASLLRMTENLLPGLVFAVQQGMPAIHGLGQLLERTGSGLGEFFTIVGKAAPQAGEAASDLGDAFRELLPLIGNMVSQGAELATLVLPAISTSFSGMNAVLQASGSILPTLLAGFLAFRVLKGLGGMFRNFSAQLGMASIQGRAYSGVAGRLASVTSTVGRALPAIGIVVGIIAAGFAAAKRTTDDWKQSLLAGGDAAVLASRQMRGLEDFWRNSSLGAHLGFLEPLADMVGLGADAYSDAAREAHNYLQTLDPLSRAQAILDRETADLANAIEDFGQGSAEAAIALQIYEAAAERVRREQEALETATTGVTQAMVDQAETSRSLADSAFGYEQALLDLDEAQEDYKSTMEDTEATERDKAQALLDLQTSYQAVGEAARDVAFDSMPALLNANQKEVLANKAQLDALLELKAQYGDLGPILENHIAELSASVSGANANKLAQAELAAALAGVGIATESIPGEKSVIINAPTEEQRQRLEDLGFTVTEIPGTKDVRVSADTAEAQENLGKIDTEMAGLDNRRADPLVALDGIPFFSTLGQVNQDIDELESERPTPIAFLQGAPFFGVARNALITVGLIARQRPTPVVSANPSAFNNIAATVMGTLANLSRQRPTPIITATDRASNVVQSVLALIRSVPASVSTTITTNVVRVYRTVGSPMVASTLAEGGAPQVFSSPIPVQKFDFGGASRFSGAVYGRGGPKDDLVPAWLSPNEHVLDSRDVDLMGGQSGVYAFREMLNAGRFGKPGADNGIRQMVAASSPAAAAPSSGDKYFNVYTSDNPTAILRTLRAKEQQDAALAAMW